MRVQELGYEAHIYSLTNAFQLCRGHRDDVFDARWAESWATLLTNYNRIYVKAEATADRNVNVNWKRWTLSDGIFLQSQISCEKRKGLRLFLLAPSSGRITQLLHCGSGTPELTVWKELLHAFQKHDKLTHTLEIRDTFKVPRFWSRAREGRRVE